ncbi:hypothetical protein [Halomonas lysinitropha]|uniref:Uncharacterized protein n=1 Tax=Halomonas lysinitropha TaxID=2607506 RepID=A0A5K1I921_9GAMM|nr:hypothetical protein [Halomonas lysinitropha]VVZ96470.1 hypothetical protein HALO32_02570 [Halomonas lysinitropha]
MNHLKRIPTSTRLIISLVTDRVMDVNLDGQHWAYLYTFTGEIRSGQYLGFRIVTMPVGAEHGDPEAVSMETDLENLWKEGLGFVDDETAKAHVEQQLTAMLDHLDSLLIDSMSEGPALQAVTS